MASRRSKLARGAKLGIQVSQVRTKGFLKTPKAKAAAARLRRLATPKSILASLKRRKLGRPCLTHFDIGELFVSEGTLRLLNASSIESALYAHQHCDWGDVSRAEAQRNNAATRNPNARIRSVHHARHFQEKTVEFWITTQNYITTVSLPGEV